MNVANKAADLDKLLKKQILIKHRRWNDPNIQFILLWKDFVWASFTLSQVDFYITNFTFTTGLYIEGVVALYVYIKLKGVKIKTLLNLSCTLI